jgi:hypothetical protein
MHVIHKKCLIHLNIYYIEYVKISFILTIIWIYAILYKPMKTKFHTKFVQTYETL